MSLPKCPQCSCEYTYEDGDLFVCPDCGFEWSKDEQPSQFVVKDAHGNTLCDGDSVVIIKDLKVKGSSSPIKAGTKVKNIRLVNKDHNIDCRIDSFGAMALKSEFVKKA